MSEYAVVVFQPVTDPAQLDFASKEATDVDEVMAIVRDVLVNHPDAWRMIHVLHIEDLPAMIEGPPEATSSNDFPQEPT